MANILKRFLVAIVLTRMFVSGAATTIDFNSLPDSGDDWTLSFDTVILNGAGPYVLTGDAREKGTAVCVSADATVTISNLCLKVKETTMKVDDGKNLQLLLAGENILESFGYAAAIEVEGSATVTITNAPYDAYGKLTAIGGDYSACIGCSNFRESDGGTVTILGGTIIARSEYAKGSGIGGGGLTGKVYIRGGNITSGCIGPGYNVKGGHVEIYGGQIDANACWGASGIGGTDTEIFICGGRINATGGSMGGIGGGYLGPASSVVIRGGTIVSGGDKNALYANKITIAGGSVNASSFNVSPSNDVGDVLVQYQLIGDKANTRVVLSGGYPDYYGQDDLYTDDSGRVYLWLPAGYSPVISSEAPPVRIGVKFSNSYLFRDGLRLDQKVANIADKSQQPIVGDSCGLQTTVVFKDGTRSVADSIALFGTRVYFAYKQGFDNWGWGSSSGINWIPLCPVETGPEEGGTNLTFRSSMSIPDSLIALRSPGVLQYTLKVVYLEDGVEFTHYLDASTEWEKPTWYDPVDCNAGKIHTSAYSSIETIAPDQAWINEVNVYDGKNSNNENQYIEIASPMHDDLMGWKLKIIQRDFTEDVLFSFDGSPKSSADAIMNGVRFMSIASPRTFVASGGADFSAKWNWIASGDIQNGTLSYYSPFALVLESPSGAWRHVAVFSGTNPYSQYYFGEEYEPETFANNFRNHYGFDRVTVLGKDEGAGSLSCLSHEGWKEGAWRQGASYTPERQNHCGEDEWQIIPVEFVSLPKSVHASIYLQTDGEVVFDGRKGVSQIITVLQGQTYDLHFTLPEYCKVVCAAIDGTDVLKSVEKISDTEYVLPVPVGQEFYRTVMIYAAIREDADLPNGNYTVDWQGVSWIVSVYNGEAAIGPKDENGNPRCVSAIADTSGLPANVELPARIGKHQITAIEPYAIADCDTFASVRIPDGVVDIGASAFRGCNGLTSVNIPNGVTNIGASAFQFCTSLQSIELPQGLISIGVDAFWECGLKSLLIPASAVAISERTFNGAYDISVEAGNPKFAAKDGALYDLAFETILFWPSNRKIAIPFGVKHIASYAFNGNVASRGETLNLPNSVTDVGVMAFADCALSGLKLGEGLASIKDWAFSYNNFRAVVLPSSVYDFAGCAFSGCTHLKALYFEGDAPRIAWPFYDSVPAGLVLYARAGGKGWSGDESTDLPERWPTTSLTEYTRPLCVWSDYPNVPEYPMVTFDLGFWINTPDYNLLNQVVDYGGSAVAPSLNLVDKTEFLGWDNDFSNVTSDLVVRAQYRMVDYANGQFVVRRGNIEWSGFFTGDGGLSIYQVRGPVNGRLTLPEELEGYSVRSFNYGAFRECVGLQEIEVPDSITDFEQALCGCLEIKNIILGDKNPHYFFKDSFLFRRQGSDLILCWAVDNKVEVVVPEGVNSLGRDLCMGSLIVERVVLPSTLRGTYGRAFTDCRNLKEIAIAEGCANFAFENGVLYFVRDGVKSSALLGLPSRLSFAIANTVEDIQEYAFANNENLTEIVIPASVRWLAYGAFEGCANLKAIYLEGDAPNCNCSYSELAPDLIVYARKGSKGWGGADDFAMPDRWPINDAYYGRPVRLWEEAGPILYEVLFDFGGQGVRSGGGDPMQHVIGGVGALPPEVQPLIDFQFLGWESDTSCVISNMNVAAKYQRIGAYPDGAYTETVGDYTWKFRIKNGYAEIVSTDGWNTKEDIIAISPEPHGDLVIPAMLGGCPVARIGDMAFQSCWDLRSVTMPDTVVELGNTCFFSCHGLSNVVFSSGLKTIGEGAFSNCIELHDVELPSQLEVIGENAFSCGGLGHVTIPESVIQIGRTAFAPQNYYTTIIEVDPANPSYTSVDGALYNKSKKVLYAWPCDRRIRIEEGVCDIQPAVFRGNFASQKLVEVPASVTNIGEMAFADCQFENIVLNEGLQSVEYGAFMDNPKLKYIVFPSTFRRMGARIISGCENLHSLYFKGDAPVLMEYPAFGQDGDLQLYVRAESRGWSINGELPTTWPHIEPGTTFDDRRYTVNEWVTYPNIAWRVSFNLLQYGTRIGGGELTQFILDGQDAVAPDVAPVEGAVFVGWNVGFTQVMENLTATAVYADDEGKRLPSYYVSSTGSDENDGLHATSSFATIQRALRDASDGDLILVDAGVYPPIAVSTARSIVIQSQHGAASTFIDGGFTNRCAYFWNPQSGPATNVSLIGFSLINGQAGENTGGGVRGGSLRDCVISNCAVIADLDYYAYGGGAYESTLINCLVANNTAQSGRYAYGGGTCDCKLYNCTIFGNWAISGDGAAYGGGVSWGSAYNTISVGNYVMPGSQESDFYANVMGSCIDGRYRDPILIDPANGDFRLYAKSPCIDAGNNANVLTDEDLAGSPRIQNGIVDIGAYEGGVVMKPDTPAGVSVTEDRAGEIEVTWDTGRFAEGYVVLRANRDSISKATQVAVVEGSSYLDADVNPAYTYYYWICATNEFGRSEYCDSVRGTCSDPVVIETEDANIEKAVALGEYSYSLEASGGVAPYQWEVVGEDYVADFRASTFEKCGVFLGWNKDMSEWRYELPFDFPCPGGKTTRYVFLNMCAFLDLRAHDALDFENEVYAYFDILGSPWLLATEPDDGIYIVATSDSVTFRWQAHYADDLSLSANCSITLNANGQAVIKYGDGNAFEGPVGFGTWDYSVCVGSAGDHADDIILEPFGLPPGLELTEEGEIVGVATRPGTYKFMVSANESSGGSASKCLTIRVEPNENQQPVVNGWSPHSDAVQTYVGEVTRFEFDVADPEGKELLAEWYLDGELVSVGKTVYDYEPVICDDERRHVLECRVSDELWKDDNAVSHRWLIRAGRKVIVDAEKGYDWPEEGGIEPDGSAERPYKSLLVASDFACACDVIYVAPGRYVLNNVFEGVTVQATGSREETIIEGSYITGDRYNGSQLIGFTLSGASVDSMICRDCVLRDAKSDLDRVAGNSILSNCLITANVVNWITVEDSMLYHCTVASNVGDTCGGLRGCEVFDSIVYWNTTSDGRSSNVYVPEYEDDYYSKSAFHTSCVWPAQPGEDNISDDPMFVDAYWSDCRLRVGTPAMGLGVDFLAQDVAGFVISTRVQGYGEVLPHTAIVNTGESATFEVGEQSRPLIGFSFNGNPVGSSKACVIENVTEDGIVTAVFSNYTFYVDQSKGDDGNDGLTRKKAKATIQAALDAAFNGETIVVAPGTYDPIVGYGRKVLIVSEEGAEKTIINAMDRNITCANLGSRERANGEPGAYGDWYGTNTILKGFTLTGGLDVIGGGAIGGTLESCIISNNAARVYGGGVYASVCKKCLIVDNHVDYDGGEYAMMWNYGGKKGYYGRVVAGGGAYRATLFNCTVSCNDVFGEVWDEWGQQVAIAGGGVARCEAWDSILYMNGEEDADEWSHCHNCVTSADEDPKFADFDARDFRLRQDSPYVVGGRAVVGCYATPYFDLPGTPQNVAASDDESCVIYVTWDAAVFAEKYRVYRATRDDFKVAECIAEVRECEFADRPADIIPEYYYWVQGVNGGGVGKVSESAIGWCDIDKEPEEADNPVYDPSSEYYDGFCEWAVSNGLIEVESAAYPAQVRSAALALDAKGEPIWQDFIAGTDPTDKNDVFKIVDARFENGDFKITWSPDLNENGTKSIRKYTEFGRKELGGTEAWTNMKDVNPAEKNDYKFRKVMVDMP